MFIYNEQNAGQMTKFLWKCVRIQTLGNNCNRSKLCAWRNWKQIYLGNAFCHSV